ncbi:hypothetical protein DW1_1457 [Proteiniborus sp. DW1]|uniref:DUF3899 domain-containing protein n=1 Tax=Proteiniborus sp. DW1 TaxID=1889883 RepID=UPI00092DF1BF|nr:DUF3899 domain-containing protein [Proteiniborus sp. DW1]SCG83028.1 hypothetical protein DW1_1457 [Proteiniborus sp. DW1]
MDMKSFLSIIVISIIIVMLLMYVIYGFDMRLMYLSNVFFFVGVVYFFLGLIFITNATEVFSGIGYLSRKAFSKDKGDGSDFKSFYDYKEYKENRRDEKYKNSNYNTRFKGLNVLIVGGVYILVSIVINMVI